MSSRDGGGDGIETFHSDNERSFDERLRDLEMQKSELEQVLEEMSEEIEKRDESIEKAAKVIQMLRSDLEKSVEDLIAHEDERDLLKNTCSQLSESLRKAAAENEASQTQIASLTKQNAKLSEHNSPESQQVHDALRLSYSSEIDALRKALHKQQQLHPPQQQHLQSLLFSPLVNTTFSSNTSPHQKSASLPPQRKTQVEKIIASAHKQKAALAKNDNTLPCSCSSIVNGLHYILKEETELGENSTAAAAMDNAIEKLIEDINYLKKELQKEQDNNFKLSELLREHQVVIRVQDKQLNEQKILIEVVSSMLDANLEEFSAESNAVDRTYCETLWNARQLCRIQRQSQQSPPPPPPQRMTGKVKILCEQIEYLTREINVQEGSSFEQSHSDFDQLDGSVERLLQKVQMILLERKVDNERKDIIHRNQEEAFEVSRRVEDLLEILAHFEDQLEISRAEKQLMSTQLETLLHGGGGQRHLPDPHLMAENEQLQALIIDQRLEIEHLQLRGEEATLRLTSLSDEHSQAVIFAEGLLKDLEKSVSDKERLSQDNLALHDIIKELDRAAIAAATASATAHSSFVSCETFEREQSFLRGTIRDRESDAIAIRREYLAKIEEHRERSEHSSQILSAITRYFSEMSLAPLPPMNIEILLLSNDINHQQHFKALIEAISSYQSLLSTVIQQSLSAAFDYQAARPSTLFEAVNVIKVAQRSAGVMQGRKGQMTVVQQQTSQSTGGGGGEQQPTGESTLTLRIEHHHVTPLEQHQAPRISVASPPSTQTLRESMMRFCKVLNQIAEGLIESANRSDSSLVSRANAIPNSHCLIAAQTQLALLNLLSHWKKSLIDTSSLFHELSVHFKSLTDQVMQRGGVSSTAATQFDVHSFVQRICKQSFFDEVMAKISAIDEQQNTTPKQQQHRSTREPPTATRRSSKEAAATNKTTFEQTTMRTMELPHGLPHKLTETTTARSEIQSTREAVLSSTAPIQSIGLSLPQQRRLSLHSGVSPSSNPKRSLIDAAGDKQPHQTTLKFIQRS